MELPLAQGLLPDYPCGERTVVLFVASVVGLSCFCALFFWLSRMLPPTTWESSGHLGRVAYLDDPPQNQNSSWHPDPKTAGSAPVGLFALAILIASLVPPFSHSLLSIVATDTSIIGTSCYMASTERDVFDRAEAHIMYRYDYGRNHGRIDWLEVRQGSNRPLIVSLDRNRYLNNWAQIAPDAIREYRAQPD